MKMEKWIDISIYQGDINFQQVKDSGIAGVVVRAGYGNSITQEDRNFRKNMNGAKAVGLKVAVYWFCYATDILDAEAEAQACHIVIKDFLLDLPVFYDFEGYTIRYMTEQGADLTKCSENIVAFNNKMNTFATNTALYSNPASIERYLDSSIKFLPLWIANWKKEPDTSVQEKYFDFNVIGWQYANHQDGTIAGIGNVDCNIFYIEEPIIEVIPDSIPVPAPVPEVATPQEVTNYTVQYGECLSVIGEKLGVNWIQIAEKNGIVEPYTIHAGDVLQISDKPEVIEQVTSNTYTVQDGECLSLIAQKTGTNWGTLAEINGLTEPYIIHAGELISLS